MFRLRLRLASLLLCLSDNRKSKYTTREELDELIRVHEQRHGMDSEEMLSRMKTGELDSYEYMAWASLLDLRDYAK